MIITDEIKIENGWVMGTVSTNKVGSDCTFPVCTVEDYKEMTEDQALKALEDALWESGYCNLHF